MDAKYLEAPLPGEYSHPNVRLRIHLPRQGQQGKPYTHVFFLVGEMDEIQREVVLEASQLQTALDLRVNIYDKRQWREMSVRELFQQRHMRSYRVAMAAIQEEFASLLRAYRLEIKTDAGVEIKWTADPPEKTVYGQNPRQLLTLLRPVEATPISFERLWHFANVEKQMGIDLAKTPNPHQRKTGEQYIGLIEGAVVLLDVPKTGWDCVMLIVDFDVVALIADGRKNFLASRTWQAWCEENRSTDDSIEANNPVGDDKAVVNEEEDAAVKKTAAAQDGETSSVAKAAPPQKPPKEKFGATIGEQLEAKQAKSGRDPSAN